MKLLNIDEACEDGEAKYYAAVLFDNAATTLLAGTIDLPAIETPDGPLVAYNIYLSADYKKMKADPSLPESLKSLLDEDKLSLEAEFTSQSLEGWHVLRTPTPLAGDQLRETLSAIHQTLESQFYSKSRSQIGAVKDNLIMQEVYKI